MKKMKRTSAIAALAVIALAAAGCSSSGSSSPSSGSTTGSGGGTVDFYSSLPMQGASSAQTIPLVNGIKLALSQAGGKAGQWTVNYQVLDDSTAAAGKWDPGQTAGNARKVASDPKAVYYMGEFNSGASEVSIPILKQAGCTKVAVANDKEAYGQGLATLLGLEKGYYGVNIASNTGIDPTSPNFRSFASTVKGQGADCFFFAGIVSNGAVQITKDVHSAIPTAKVFGGDGVCTDSYTNATKGGIPASLYPLTQCTVATQNLEAYPGGKDFLAAYKAKYGGSEPDPYAIYGYEVMNLGLDTVKSLGAKGNDKAAVLKALFDTKNRQSVLGTYGFNSNGDTTLKSYGLYKVGSDGEPVFFKTLTPTKTVS